MQDVILELDVPGLIAEHSIQPDQRWILSLVAPRELRILEVDFLKLALVESAAELCHPPTICVALILIACPVNEVDVA